MSAEEDLRQGDYAGALSKLQDQVRKSPSDSRLRIFLFQLLCIGGDWDRALRQLKVSAELNPEALPMAQTYREAIICEVFREKVFSGEKAPLIFGEPPDWVALMSEALRVEAEGNGAAAADLRGRAFEEAETAAGTLNGAPFQWIADADMRLGPLLEIIINGRYFWLPFESIAKISAEAPEDLRDSVWMPVNLQLRNGGSMVALIPSRYPGTAGSERDDLKLGRATEWAETPDGTYTGLGQRMLATDEADVALLDLRELVMEGAEDVPDGADGAADG